MASSVKFNIIVACAMNGGIGVNGGIPWHLPEDLKQFKRLTTNAPTGKLNAVIMGRRTMESLPLKYLPHRINVIISQSLTDFNTLAIPVPVFVYPTLEVALKGLGELQDQGTLHETFVIGGERLYGEAVDHPQLNHVYLTYVECVPDCDVSFPLEHVQTRDRLLYSERLAPNAMFYVYDHVKFP